MFLPFYIRGMKEHHIPRNETEDEFLLVPKCWLKSIEETQQKILSLLQQGDNTHSVTGIGDYITEAEAKKLLGRKTTWFWQMRTGGRLPFSKVGNKIYYHKDDITKLLKDNRQNPFSNAA